MALTCARCSANASRRIASAVRRVSVLMGCPPTQRALVSASSSESKSDGADDPGCGREGGMWTTRRRGRRVVEGDESGASG
jgi:hypothetical protein